MKTNLDVVLERYKTYHATYCLFCKHGDGHICKSGSDDCPTHKEQLDWLMQETEENVVLTDDEKNILKNIDSLYKWIVREECGDLLVYHSKPTLDDYGWESKDGIYAELGVFNHLFEFIAYESGGLYYIPDLLKGGTEND